MDEFEFSRENKIEKKTTITTTGCGYCINLSKLKKK